jgi:Iodothyronine deiodinase
LVVARAATAAVAQTGTTPKKLDPGQAALQAILAHAYADTPAPESVRMLMTIAGGGRMGNAEGWFGPGRTRYTWQWLVHLHGAGAAQGITRDQFRGSPEWFTRLDRDKNGTITADDLDWSDQSAYQQRATLITRVFRRMNADNDGKLTEKEWLAFFKEAAKDKTHLSADELRDALLSTMANPPRMGGKGGGPPSDMLVRGLFRCEIGSVQEGPRLNEPAPDFLLRTLDGKERLHLVDLSAGKPTVLVFGNYTCTPFRNTYPGVDAICQRYRDMAVFKAVYVREAHPSDGWSIGADIPQPKTYAERVALADRCDKSVKYSMPLLVDEINDPAGNAYSGMPSRLYVIDRHGKVAYKSGRGPHGYRPAETEQALVMALLEQQMSTDAAAEAANRR